MPVYKLPALKKTKSSNAADGSNAEPGFPARWERQINIPVNKDIIDELKVNEKAEITLVGTITGLSTSSNSSSGSNVERADVTIEITAVEVNNKESESVYEDLAND